MHELVVFTESVRWLDGILHALKSSYARNELRHLHALAADDRV